MTLGYVSEEHYRYNEFNLSAFNDQSKRHYLDHSCQDGSFRKDLGMYLTAVLVPLNHNSRSLRGRRTTWGGRVAVRTALTIAIQAAKKRNPVIRAAYRQFCIAGKAPKSPSSRAYGGC